MRELCLCVIYKWSKTLCVNVRFERMCNIISFLESFSIKPSKFLHLKSLKHTTDYTDYSWHIVQRVIFHNTIGIWWTHTVNCILRMFFSSCMQSHFWEVLGSLCLPVKTCSGGDSIRIPVLLGSFTKQKNDEGGLAMALCN